MTPARASGGVLVEPSGMPYSHLASGEGIRMACEYPATLDLRRGMRGCSNGGARNAHAKTISLLIAATAVPILLVGQSVVAAAAPNARVAGRAALQSMTPALAAQLSKNVDRGVIVILKSQLGPAHAGSRAAMLRSDKIANDQAPLMSELREVHATHIRSYQLVNSFAATVSAGEEARLSADPTIAEVIPD